MKFSTILADPPWPYGIEGPRAAPSHRPKSWDSVKGATDSKGQYGAIEMKDLLSLRPPANENAHCYIWTTNSFMVEAHELMAAWGFKAKTILTWVKMKQGSNDPSMRTGFYFRGATEHVVFGVRGSLRLATSECLPTAFFWPRLPHSVKPYDFYEVVEKASPGPYLEMFHRPDGGLFGPREGWTFIGNEVTGRDIRDDLRILTETEK